VHSTTADSIELKECFVKTEQLSRTRSLERDTKIERLCEQKKKSLKDENKNKHAIMSMILTR
jgi:hypothetical protein